MKVNVQYGSGGLAIEIPSENVTVLAPKMVAGLPAEEEAFRTSVRNPIGAPPLGEVVRSHERVAIVIPDLTRPLAVERLLPWILSELRHVPESNVTVINGTGSHRANTPEELASMVGADVVARFRIVNHSAHEPDGLLPVGKSPGGRTVLLTREYVEADRRVVIGFIEPHFMAGFSGGYKGVFPALADIDSIMEFHSAAVIGDPHSTWGVLEGNPTQERIRACGALLPVDFCINVTQNRRREITGFFCGRVDEAHARGCELARSAVMVPCEQPFPIVVTTNGGFPLDQNLYQSVKGMSAAAQIVREGGFILAASECRDGFPAHGNFRRLLFEHGSAEATLQTILSPGFSVYDQWEAQILAMILSKARVGLHSAIEPAEVRRAHLEPVGDITERLRREIRSQGGAPIAVLPEGPMTIPYLAG